MGLFIPPASVVQGAAFAFSLLQQIGVVAATPDSAVAKTGIWRPPEWNRPPGSKMPVPLYSLTVDTSLPGSSSPNPNDIVPLPGAPPFPQSTVYVFDAVLRAEHRREIRLTHHPVQTGEAISDHAFVEPAEVTL
ncbi:MAG: phage baseplate protein, partial [Candidatus Acidiferrales bacterium]